MYNRAASSGDRFSRKFDIEGHWLDNGEQADVLTAAFFDIHENVSYNHWLYKIKLN